MHMLDKQFISSKKMALKQKLNAFEFVLEALERAIDADEGLDDAQRWVDAEWIAIKDLIRDVRSGSRDRFTTRKTIPESPAAKRLRHADAWATDHTDLR